MQVTFFLLPKFLDLADNVENLIGDLANRSKECDASGSGSGESDESIIDKLLEDQDKIVNGVRGKKICSVEVFHGKQVSVSGNEVQWINFCYRSSGNFRR